MSCILWFDVEDMFQYARSNARPSGIQRVTFQIYGAMQRRYGAAGRVRFVRHRADGRSLVPIDWEVLERTFSGIADAPTAMREPSPTLLADIAPRLPQHPSVIRRTLRQVASYLPNRIRKPLVLFSVLQVQAVAALLTFMLNAIIMAPGAAGRGLDAAIRARRGGAPRAETSKSDAFANLAHRNDVLIVLGSPWFNAEYAALVGRLRREAGMRFAVLVHDIVPLRHPEWCDHALVRVFRTWYSSVLPVSDVIFSVSQATADDLECYAASVGIRLYGRVQRVPIGTGFGDGNPPAEPEGDKPVLPEPGSYVLFVSTIEARKNHSLLFRVWRKMVDELPLDEIPTLVFAGRVGWLVTDLMQQLDNARYLDGKIRLVLDPTDATLRRLYGGCLFTLFPSLFEGWGLPVTESLAFGKPCIASNRTSVPEAGGPLARYFDPESLPDAYRVIRAAIDDRAGLAAWQDRVVREFHPVSWDETAAAIFRRLDTAASVAIEPIGH